MTLVLLGLFKILNTGTVIAGSWFVTMNKLNWIGNLNGGESGFIIVREFYQNVFVSHTIVMM